MRNNPPTKRKSKMLTPKGISFEKKDIVNPQDFIPKGKYNPQGIRAFLIQTPYGIGGVALAASLDEALDILVDEERLLCLEVDESEPDVAELEEYGAYHRLGNCGTLCDLRCVRYEVFDLWQIKKEKRNENV